MEMMRVRARYKDVRTRTSNPLSAHPFFVGHLLLPGLTETDAKPGAGGGPFASGPDRRR